MTYERLKKLLAAGTTNTNDILKKMDIFLISGRITEEEYQELIALAKQ